MLSFKEDFITYLKEEQAELLNEVEQTKQLSDSGQEKLIAAIQVVKKMYKTEQI